MQVPDELRVLKEKQLHKNAIVKVVYGSLGSRLACASQDQMITVIKTPVFNNTLDMTTLSGHNGAINYLHISSND